MDESDLALRNLTYRHFVAEGRAPHASEVASEAGLDVEGVRAGWRRLHEMHALVLDSARLELRMVNPFSAVATPYRVQAGGRWWYANCAWDAFGILGALHSDGLIQAACPDCGEPLNVEVMAEKPRALDLVFHCLLPARRWWEDIALT